MANLNKLARLLLIGSCVAMAGVYGGCTKKPSQDELSKLEEAKQAAESAEKKLTELKQERMQLEATLQSKQGELKQNEDERDDLKKKTGK